VKIRIHTRVPVTLPSRLTPELVSLLAEFSVSVFTHFNHPRELAEENIAVLKNLLAAGLIVKNQSVLLHGVNDSTEVLRDLIVRLADLGVKQHAIHHLDAAKGTSHFRVSLARGKEIVRGLGELAPPYYLDDPNGGGKCDIIKSCPLKNEKSS
jgi:lysine 2,3-aminomutase